MKENERLDFLTRVKESPPVYFVNSLEEAAIKSLPGNRFEVRMKSGTRFIQEPSETLSNLIAEGMLEANEISEEEFLKY